MDEIDPRVEDWLKGRKSRWGRFLRQAQGIWHSRISRYPNRYWFLKILADAFLVSAAPLIAWAVYNVITGLQAGVASLVLLVLKWLSWLFGVLSSRKVGASPADAEMVVRIGDLLTALGEMPEDPRQKDDVIRACLGIMEVFSRYITRSAKGAISVSLVLYETGDPQKMRIRHRNPGNERPVGRVVSAERMLGDRICKFDAKPRVLDDTRLLKLESPTQSDITYRSIFFYPLVADGDQAIGGFISIDAAKPFAFYGNRAKDIVVTCEPIVSRISELTRWEA